MELLDLMKRVKALRHSIVECVKAHEWLLNGGEETDAEVPDITEVVVAWRNPDGSFSYTTSDDLEDPALAAEILGEAIHQIEE